jgi:hypothetical protein
MVRTGFTLAHDALPGCYKEGRSIRGPTGGRLRVQLSDYYILIQTQLNTLNKVIAISFFYITVPSTYLDTYRVIIREKNTNVFLCFCPWRWLDMSQSMLDIPQNKIKTCTVYAYLIMTRYEPKHVASTVI